MRLLVLVAALGCVGGSLGLDCSPFARPWLVSLSGQTGVLLNEWWVLTNFDYNSGSHQLEARLGVDDLNGQSNTEQRVRVARWINHDPYSGFRRRKRSPMHDLALVRLAEPARFTPYVQPMALPTQCPQTGELCVVTGWGSTGSGPVSKKQQCLVQQVLSDNVCRQLNPMYWSSNLFCTGSHHTAEGSCLRDRSSILVCGGTLQGVNGFVFVSEGCSAGKPDAYSRICRYRSWIDRVMSTMTPTVGPYTTTPPTPPPVSTTWRWDDHFVS
ncbi:trypsinogen-like protein 3 isoform X2 [Clupea harengus]|uniref:Trypsinogen-like protein 3 isoform X2 n=1 Tax=Clupea harengus TaxID=7950 RepID=A0A6P8GBA2_CLUHA|nr:trypsinogen-like protein 3 isoform X2 [Clupea harengus]